MATFALAHMSCAGAWAWGEVPEYLRRHGHDVVAPDFDLAAGVTPMDHVQALVDAVGDARDVVVAGHSYGGLVALPAAEALGARARAVVLIDGIVADDGETGFAARPEQAAGRRAEAARRGDGMWTSGEPSPGDPAWFRHLAPMPISAFESPIRLTGAVDGLPRTYVLCEKWGMADQATRARQRGWKVVQVEASHGFPLEDPAACAKLLLDALPV